MTTAGALGYPLSDRTPWRLRRPRPLPPVFPQTLLPQFRPVRATLSSASEAALPASAWSPPVVAIPRPQQIASPVARPRALPAAALFGTALVAAYVVAAYLLISQVFPGRMSATTDLYVVRPLVWGGLALLAFLLWHWLPDRPALGRTIMFGAAVAGAFQISLLIIGGLMYGFGHSPYSREALSIAKNALYVSTLLLGLEMSRAYLLHAWGRINAVLAFAVVATLFAVVAITPGQYGLLGEGREPAAKTIGSLMLPAASQSVISTFLTSIGGPLPAFAYRFVLAGFEWFSPILPNLDWPIAAFLGTLGPLLAMLIVRDMFADAHEEEAAGSESSGIGLSPITLLAGIALVGLIWLNTGMFGVQPALVSGHSMQPRLNVGDVVFTRHVAIDSLRVGDIVRYRRGDIAVMHRIIEIPQHVDGPIYTTAAGDTVNVPDNSGGPLFITKGDNNNSADNEAVTASEIEGKIVFTLPYAGWLPISLKGAIAWVR